MADESPGDIAQRMSEAEDTDVFLYIGAVNVAAARNIVESVGARKRKRKNLYFIIGTNGGDPHPAYSIARCLQHAYEAGKVTVAVYGECKSAGTLIAIAANRIVMCQHGELGPLDVQIKKDDQFYGRSSGLTTAQALESLKRESFSQFEHFLIELHKRTGYEISAKMAASMSIRMAVGMLAPIYQQMNPMQIGETQRAMDIAKAYGERLDQLNQNLKLGALTKLIESYPSHEFVIDFDEAKALFHRISQTTEQQKLLGSSLAHVLLDYKLISSNSPIILYLNEEPKIVENEATDSDSGVSDDKTNRPNDSKEKRVASTTSGNDSGGGGKASAEGSRQDSTGAEAARNGGGAVRANRGGK